MERFQASGNFCYPLGQMRTNTSQPVALLRLFFTPKLGGASLRKILERWGPLDLQGLEYFIKALPKEPGHWEGIPVSYLKGAQDEEVRRRAEKEWGWMEKNNVRMVSI